MVEVCPQCDIAGCYHIREREADPLSPARVEAMAREYCRIMGLDGDEFRKNYHNWLPYRTKASEFIAMMDAYERTKG